MADEGGWPDQAAGGWPENDMPAPQIPNQGPWVARRESQPFGYPEPSWLEAAKKRDLPALVDIAKRSREYFVMVETSDRKVYTIGPVNSEAFGEWVRGWNAKVWPRTWTQESLEELEEALEVQVLYLTSAQLDEGLARAGCWCHACDEESGRQFRPQELATPNADHVMTRYAEEWDHWTAVGYAIQIGYLGWLEVLLKYQAPFCLSSWAYIPISSGSQHDADDLIPALAYAVHSNDLECARLCVAYGANPMADTHFYCGHGGTILTMAQNEEMTAVLTAPIRYAAKAARTLLLVHKFGEGNDLFRAMDRHVVLMIAKMVHESRYDPEWRATCKPDCLY